MQLAEFAVEERAVRRRQPDPEFEEKKQVLRNVARNSFRNPIEEDTKDNP